VAEHKKKSMGPENNDFVGGQKEGAAPTFFLYCFFSGMKNHSKR